MEAEELEFDPIPRIWRFHAIYFLICLAMGAAMYPFKSSISFFFLAAFCVVGVGLSAVGEDRGAHILPAGIGLITPFVFLGALVPLQTLIGLAALVVIFYLLRNIAF